ncbi:MAG: cytochrome c [Myxococcota bacterium]
MSRARAVLILAVVASVGVGCWEQVSKGWFAQMKQQPAVQALESEPRVPPEGTVPVGGYVIRIKPDNPLFMNPMHASAARALVNPIPPSEQSIARGKEIYTTYCAICHAADGMSSPANNPVARRLGESGAPPFPLSTTVAYTDGQIFTKILYGKPLMPGYPNISPEDRWHAVNYLRTLFRGGSS